MIRIATEDDVPALVAHMQRYMPQSGMGGPRFSPHPRGHVSDRTQQLRASMPVSTKQAGWLRCFCLVIGEKIVGHAEISGGRIASELHRATLGLGIEAEFRGMGYGRQLVMACVEWCRAEGLDWLDLGVFSSNTRALRLYENMGFVRTGMIVDRFRPDGESIDDIQMSLDLRR